ncbi:relaxase domain-containing protein (plasmid) [Amycolatopsis sp. FU40]|uniref:MobF family relaxase n=1 Tax=Amycolatopsis sp. FU40 TaxID=2914159 RepID=UPI001F441C86|nr:MobF family relaxase [Amycolatopsis sp. FU40]UKD50742.1 relaxase domain-containing protein [Amycolatopsis sp. FU40]
MLRITAVSAGAVDYLLKGSGCAEHEHAQERGINPDAPGYYISAVEHGEAPGVWFGSGLDMLGMEAGTAATADDVRTIFGELKHPDTGDFLGRRPRKFKDYEQRVEAALAREPNATPERVREIEDACRTDGRKAVAYYDFTFSPQKSVSLLEAAYVAAGDYESSAKLRRIHREAAEIGLKVLEKHGSYVRTGYHGRTANGRSVGRYERATGMSGVLFEHSTNRENEPQLHIHAAILNRVVTDSDGKIRALDSKGFRPIKEAIASAYERALEDKMTEELGVVFAWRPDGKAREIMGVDPSLVAEASTRRSQVEERVDELVEAYVDRHGREPSPAARKAIAQMATLDTRKDKGPEAGPQALRSWAEERADRLAAMLDRVEEAAAEVERTGHPDLRVAPDQLDYEAVVQRAIEDVQSEYATWTVGNLTAAIDRHLVRVPCAPEDRPEFVENLARTALRPGNEFGVLTLTAEDPVAMPVPLQRAEDGRSIFRPHIDEVYTTEAQLATERRITVRARQETAPAITGPELEMLRVELEATTLTADQRAAVLGVVSSGRAGDVLVGPAGTGKSYTVATLADVWSRSTGGRVMGLATSQRATDVLNEEGLEAINTTQFLRRFTPDETTGEAQDQVRRGDLFVLDEAGMSGTDEFDRITSIIEKAGGKWLATGDHRQLGAVKAGGMFELLAQDNGAYELDSVRRFSADWEKDASVRLRAGDTGVLGEYEDRGRLRGGTVEEMQEAAMRGYLADTLDGRDSMLIVRGNADAADMSRRVRDELVALGRVDANVLAVGKDDNAIGVGDVIQARKNSYSIDVQGGRGMVVNREVYTVRGVDDRGRIIAETKDGGTAFLPLDYVEQHVTLGYAGTVYSAQGRTVDSAHALFDEQTSREDAYVALTRGRGLNMAYLATERAPDEHQPELLDVDPVTAMGRILENSDPARAAELEYRAGLEDGRSLAWIGTQWDLISREWSEYRYTDAIAAGLAEMGEPVEAAQQEHGWGRLMRTLRETELAGHDVDQVLAAAIGGRQLDDAVSVTDVLRYRVREITKHRTPEQEIDGRDWTTFGPPVEGPVGQVLQEMAVLATDRQQELGEQVAEQMPQWAVDHLGTAPAEPGQREEWVRRAGVVAAYRELAAIEEDQASLGAAPSREQEFHRALWQQAHAALGRPVDALDFAIATDAELREMSARWEREQTWAPPYVADEMKLNYENAESYRQDAALYAAQLETLPEGTAEYAAALADVEMAERLAADFAERARQLEEIHAARQRWHEAAETAEVADQLARQELARRHPGGDAEQQPTPEAEQLELFRIASEAEVGPDPEQVEREPEPAQEQQQAEPEPVDERPELDADSAEHVRWWQQWRERLVGRTQQPAVEEAEEPVLDAEQDREAERAADVPDVGAAVDKAAALDQERDQRALADPGRDDEDQLALFPLSDEDRVGAQPVRVETPERETAPDGETVRESLAQVRKQARTMEIIRAQQEAAEKARAEERRREAEQEAEAERARRDRAEEHERAAKPEKDRSAENEPQRQRQADEPEIELKPTPRQPEPEPGR